MRKTIAVALIGILLSAIIPVAYADSDWEFEFFGINSKDLKGRKPIPIFIGCISSFAVHEAGHLIAGDMVGIKASMKWKDGPVAWADDYHDKSDNEKSLFHAGGFIAQILVGTALTAIPYTRHSDFSVGFNGFASVNSIVYGVTGGRDGSYSDVKQLSNYGHNGPMIAIGSGLLSGVYTYINLNKHQ